MKFILSNIDLSDVITKMGRLLTAKSTIPILEGILVEAKGNCMMFTASDGSESVIHRILMDEADGNMIVTEGRTVFTRELFTITRKLKGNITFDVHEGTHVEVTVKKTKLEFPVMDAMDYPKIEGGGNGTNIVLSGTEFAKMVTQTTFATSKVDTRPILTGVQMIFEKGMNTFIATDSHRLSRLGMIGPDNFDESIAITVPASILDLALKAFDLSKDVILIPSNNILAMGNGNTILLANILEGNYPDTSRLIPEDFETNLIVNRSELVNGLELLQAMTKNSVVKMTVDGLFVELSASGDGGKRGSQEISFESYDGTDDFVISFSAVFLLDVLKRMEDTSVRLRFNGTMRPFVVSSVDEGEKTVQLVLPVRTV